MKSTRKLLDETFMESLPYMLHILVTAVILWVANIYFSRASAEAPGDQELLYAIYNVVIICASVLWARMTYLHKKVMEKLEQIEKGKETELAK